jgi:hypothetical protein
MCGVFLGGAASGAAPPSTILGVASTDCLLVASCGSGTIKSLRAVAHRLFTGEVPDYRKKPLSVQPTQLTFIKGGCSVDSVRPLFFLGRAGWGRTRASRAAGMSPGWLGAGSRSAAPSASTHTQRPCGASLQTCRPGFRAGLKAPRHRRFEAAASQNPHGRQQVDHHSAPVFRGPAGLGWKFFMSALTFFLDRRPGRSYIMSVFTLANAP